MFNVNSCSPLRNSLADGSINIRITRIIFAIFLLSYFIAYLIISFLLKKQINNLKLEDLDSNVGKIKQKQAQYRIWEDDFLTNLGEHFISVGFVMSFSPYSFQLILSILFVSLLLAQQIKKHYFGDVLKQIKTGLRIINLTLLLCTMVGISRTQYYADGTCQDFAF